MFALVEYALLVYKHDWCCIDIFGLAWFMVFHATFNNILVISWWSVLLMEQSAESHTPVANH